MRLRSYLYVAADNAARLAKATTRGSDSLIIDLEDGVPPNQKDFARSNLRNWLSEQDSAVSIWVRVNPDSLESDCEVAVHPRVNGIILPKSGSSADIESADRILSRFETGRNWAKLEIIALIESAEGVLNSLCIAKSERVTRLILGELDLRADLALPMSAGDETLQYARNSLLYASSAAGIEPPIASVSTNFKDLERFRLSTIQYSHWGYFGRTCIHPDQIAIVNEIFSSSTEELEWARDVLTRLDEVNGASTVDARGEMIDEAVAKLARRILGIK